MGRFIPSLEILGETVRSLQFTRCFHAFGVCQVYFLKWRGRGPIVVIRGEDTALSKHPGTLAESRKRLHPMEGLAAGDDICASVGQACCMRVSLLKGQISAAGALGLFAHGVGRLDADDSVCV